MTNSCQKRHFDSIAAEGAFCDLESAISLLEHVDNEFFSDASPETAMLAYLVSQIRSHNDALYAVIFPKTGSAA